MADQAVITKIVETNHKSALVFSSQSDGTGEALATKVDISALPGAPERVKITKLSWAIADAMCVKVYFDRPDLTAPVVILNASGCLRLENLGPIEDKGAVGGGTGDIKFTTVGHLAGKGYTVEMEVESDIKG